MSVNSVPTGLPRSYSPLSGNTSRTAKSAPIAKGILDERFAKANVSQATSAEVDGSAQDASVKSGDPTDGEQFQSTLEQALREGAATGGSSTGGASSGSQPSRGLALYQRVSQYGNNEASTSALLESWNTIMQGGENADSAAAAFLKTLSQSETPVYRSGVLDLTA